MAKIKIALCSRMRAGKDTIGAYLVQKYGYTRYAFADAMKRSYHDIFGPSAGRVKDRSGYQWFGELMRQKDPYVWIRKVDESITHDAHPVITDLRMPLEYDWARQNGYVLIRVNCDEQTRIERALTADDAFDESTLHHETESHVDTFSVDYDVYNVGTLETLYAQIDAIMKTFEAEVDA